MAKLSNSNLGKYHVGPSGSLFVVLQSNDDPCLSVQIVSYSGTTSTRDITFYGSNMYRPTDKPQAAAEFINSGSDLWKWAEMPEVVVANFSGSAATPAASGSRMVNLSAVACAYIGLRLRVDHSGVFDVAYQWKRSS